MQNLLQISELATDNKKFAAIDKAIGKDSFKVSSLETCAFTCLALAGCTLQCGPCTIACRKQLWDNTAIPAAVVLQPLHYGIVSKTPMLVPQVVLLLRLSPLLPLALSNYLYGLTSVDFVPYVLGSWLGMLPGTIAYVSAGERVPQNPK